MATAYHKDIIAWSKEQAHLLRSGQLSALDIEHIAEEIEDVGKSEQRELANRMAVLLAHLLKWQFQPERRGDSWERTIREQRKAIARRVKNTPSLQASLQDAEWLADAWGDAITMTIAETSINNLPESCPWRVEHILSESWLP